MHRRKFIQNMALGGTMCSVSLTAFLAACKSPENHSQEFLRLVSDLLAEWSDGMLKNQIIEPDNLLQHGALGCPSCGFIHGRCMDAVYPFMHMANRTGDKKYLEAAILVMDWAQNNVSQEDGSWTVIPDPTSWKGITVFGAIALAEALHHHGNLLDTGTRDRWTRRLDMAVAYIYKNFDLTFTNINYGFTAVYALNLLGRVLNNTSYISRSRELAAGAKVFFTQPNKLVFGEGKPSTQKSDKGLYPVDLGYNVEESLNGLVMYAITENDEELLKLLTHSLQSHIEFMLHDGAWDNSWGTRQNKWSYWGSRTTDGCQVTYGLIANRNKAFGTAALRNTELLKRCTADGLLHGGPHYVSHGVKPCIHHTLAHAKPLAALLDRSNKLPIINTSTPLPRQVAQGVKEFPEVATWLIARGPWRATVSAYDWIYKEHAQQAAGGALAILYHTKVGLLMTASMAKYMLVEKNNQQPNPDEIDFALTPRVETFSEGKWYTNLYDLKATVNHSDANGIIEFDVKTQLTNEDREQLDESTPYQITYLFGAKNTQIRAKHPNSNKILPNTALVVPIVSARGEDVQQVTEYRIEIAKEHGTVVIEANVPLHIKETKKGRIFNMVPGVEVVPVIAKFIKDNQDEIICTISVVE